MGEWDTGYVREGGELMAFLNIDSAGQMGSDFPNISDDTVRRAAGQIELKLSDSK